MRVVRAKRLLCAALLFTVTLLMSPATVWAGTPAGVLGLATQTANVDCALSGSPDVIDEPVIGDPGLTALQGHHGDRHRCERARHKCMHECRHHGGHHHNHRHCFERCMRHHGCHHY